MTDHILTDEEAHALWVSAISRWYHTSKRDWLHRNLRNAVPLSAPNSRFLGAILDGTVKALSGKQVTSARVENNIIDRRIDDLRAQGMERKMILAVLEDEGLMPASTTIGALDKRIDGKRICPIQQRMNQDKKLAALYAKITGI